ncbi:MAG TPA: ABC transporter permease [Bryobacteraceae bacterium]|nr:ABC transporter permease [Bryobacteraceae bacterium]
MSPAVSKVEEYPVESASLWFDAWRRFRRNRAALASAILVVAVILVSLLGPWLVYLYNGFEYDTLGLDNRLANPSLKHLLGTDTLGRDLLARVLYGSRISLMVGLVSTLISLLIGVAYGAMAGYVGGRFDELLMRAVDVLYSLPDILLIVILMALFERSLLLLFIALGATSWLTMARIVRGQVLSLKHEQFVEAARCIGISNFGIVVRHILPNTVGPIIVYATLTIPSVILGEAFLSFLGLGVPPPASSLGVLAEEGAEAISVHPILLIAPGTLMAVILMSLNFLGDGLRDALDPRMRRTL